MQKSESFEFILLSVLDDWLALAALYTSITFELRNCIQRLEVHNWYILPLLSEGWSFTISMAGKDLTSGYGRFEKLQAVLRAFPSSGCFERDLKAEILGFKTQIYAKTRCNTHDFFASKTIEKTSTIIGETFRREGRERGNWIVNYCLATRLGCCKLLKLLIIHAWLIKKLKDECCLGAITIFIVFLEGTVTNPAIWLVLYPVSIFLSLPTGHGNAFVSRWVHPNFRCHFS